MGGLCSGDQQAGPGEIGKMRPGTGKFRVVKAKMDRFAICVVIQNNDFVLAGFEPPDICDLVICVRRKQHKLVAPTAAAHRVAGACRGWRKQNERVAPGPAIQHFRVFLVRHHIVAPGAKIDDCIVRRICKDDTVRTFAGRNVQRLKPAGWNIRGDQDLIMAASGFDVKINVLVFEWPEMSKI